MTARGWNRPTAVLAQDSVATMLRVHARAKADRWKLVDGCRHPRGS